MKTLQEHYLLTAIAEKGLKYSNYDIDHNQGACYIDGDFKGMIFPQSMLDLCEGLWATRTNPYFFAGLLTPKREWCAKYSGVYNSTRGRDVNVKYTYDLKYYEALGSTEFALCPTGDCPWSYRFFEAMMCGAIPVIGDGEDDVWSANFKFYRDSDIKVYRNDWADHNLKTIKGYNIL